MYKSYLKQTNKKISPVGKQQKNIHEKRYKNKYWLIASQKNIMSTLSKNSTALSKILEKKRLLYNFS